MINGNGLEIKTAEDARELARSFQSDERFYHTECVARAASELARRFGADVEKALTAAYLHDIGRAQYVPITDDEAVNAFEYLAKTEGIIPAIESSHAVAYAMKLAPTMDKDKIIVVTVSGRGDKDCAAIARYRGENIYE